MTRRIWIARFPGAHLEGVAILVDYPDPDEAADACREELLIRGIKVGASEITVEPMDERWRGFTLLCKGSL